MTNLPQTTLNGRFIAIRRHLISVVVT